LQKQKLTFGSKTEYRDIEKEKRSVTRNASGERTFQFMQTRERSYEKIYEGWRMIGLAKLGAQLFQSLKHHKPKIRK